jgi:hypothetical protein
MRKTALVAAMPRARERIAVVAKPGDRRSSRRVKRKSVASGFGSCESFGKGVVI